MHDALGIIKGESTRQSGYDAESYMRSLEQFKFTHTAFVTQHMLAFIQELSVALQTTLCDLIEVHESTQKLIQRITEIRSGKNTHSKLYAWSVKCASTIDVKPSRPRVVGRQRHCSNTVH